MDVTTWAPRLIVVGVDGSDQAQHAAALAASIARRARAKLHLVTVVRPPEGWWGIVGSPPTPNAMSNSLTRAQREILDAVAGRIDLTDVEHELIEEIGDPASTLVSHCETNGADLLVVGRQGAGLIERLVVGSVTNRVTHHAPCPVLVVP